MLWAGMGDSFSSFKNIFKKMKNKFGGETF
jgi:hypothetical protein